MFKYYEKVGWKMICGIEDLNCNECNNNKMKFKNNIKICNYIECNYNNLLLYF